MVRRECRSSASTTVFGRQGTRWAPRSIKPGPDQHGLGGVLHLCDRAEGLLPPLIPQRLLDRVPGVILSDSRPAHPDPEGKCVSQPRLIRHVGSGPVDRHLLVDRAIARLDPAPYTSFCTAAS